MTLFPQIDTAYYTDGDKTVHEMLEYYYAQNIQITQSFWSEADIDNRFKAGDQTLWNDIYGNLPASRKRQFNFNRIRRLVNMVSGYQRQNRFSTIVTSREDSDEETSDQLSKTLIWANQEGNVLQTISEAFEGAITTGMNLLSVWLDHREDPISGDIRVDNTSYNEYLIDSFFKKHDLSDCRFIWTRKWLSKTEIKSLLPDRKEELDSMYARGWRDGKFQFQPEAYNYAMQDLLTYDEFWYRDYRTRKLLVDPSTGQTLEWRGNEEDLNRFLGAFPNVTYVDQIIPTIKLAIVVNGRTLWHGRNPLGIDRYPFVPVLGYYEPQIPYFPWRIQGIVRGLRDAQYLYNRRKVIELDILESQINSGIKYKEDALVNPKDAFLQGQGRGLAIKKEASMDDVQVISPPQIAPSMIQLSEILGREIQEISGINEELLGSASDDKSGVLSMLRQGAGLTTLQILFDQLNQSQKYLGQIFLELIQENFSAGKVARIIGQPPTEQFYSRAFQKYDIVVEEGLNTSTQKQMQFAQLLNLREAGIPVPAKTLINSSTLQNKKQLIEDIEQEQEQQQQVASEQAQYQQQLQAAQMQYYQAKATADTGLGIERLARVEEDRALAVERIAQAQNQRALSVYNELRAAKELQNLDLHQLDKFVAILRSLKEVEKMEEKQQLEQVASKQNIPQQPMANNQTRGML